MRTIKGKQWIVTTTLLAWDHSQRVVVSKRSEPNYVYDTQFVNCSIDFILSSILNSFGGTAKNDFSSCLQLKEILEQLFPHLDNSSVNLLPLDTSLYEQYIEEWNAENLSAEELYRMENLAG